MRKSGKNKMMAQTKIIHDFKGIGFSKVGHFKEVRSKIKELENLNFELNRRSNKLEAIFNSMSGGLTVLNRNLDIVAANQVQIDRFPNMSIIGSKCHSIFFQKDTICRDCPVLRTLVSEKPGRGETFIKKGRFSGRYFEWTVSPVRDPFGSIDEIILVMSDITERKENELKLMQADRMAMVGFLAAGVAHEINNPLASIAGFSEGLLKRLNNPRMFENDKLMEYFREYLEIIHGEAYRCTDIIRNLLDYSRDSGDDLQIIPINEIIRDTMSLIRQHAKDNNISIVFKDCLETGANCISGNESQMKYIFLNLFNKMFRNMEHGGQLEVLAENDEDMIEIRISENKCPDDGLEYIENGGYADVNPKRVEQGETTLSMSICYNILKHYNADIHFSVKKGFLSSCFLRFPVIRTCSDLKG